MTRLILLMAVLAVAVFAPACGSTGSSGTAATAPGASQPVSTAAATPKADSKSRPRAEVHAYAARMMADIKAAEDRGDVIDGVTVGASSNPYDYVGVSPLFVKIVALGKPALPAIAAEILASNENGLREYLLAAAGAQISGDTPGSGQSQSWSSGKEWAKQFREAEE